MIPQPPYLTSLISTAIPQHESRRRRLFERAILSLSRPVRTYPEAQVALAHEGVDDSSGDVMQHNRAEQICSVWGVVPGAFRVEWPSYVPDVDLFRRPPAALKAVGQVEFELTADRDIWHIEADEAVAIVVLIRFLSQKESLRSLHHQCRSIRESGYHERWE